MTDPDHPPDIHKSMPQYWAARHRHVMLSLLAHLLPKHGAVAFDRLSYVPQQVPNRRSPSSVQLQRQVDLG